MGDLSDDAYLLEVMASHAALAFRPDIPKVNCRCKCEERVDALIDAFNQMADASTERQSIKSREMVKPQVGAAAIGAAAGIAATLIVRKLT